MTRRQWWLAATAIALVAIAASAVGIRNGFAYDDVFVVQQNPRVHSLHGIWRTFAEPYWPRSSGSDGYRPLTIVAFGLQWAAGHGAPWIFHAVNVALNALASVLVFWLATLLLPGAWAVVVAALFAVHPVHVEAVANVVGQSELWVACLFTLAMGLYLKARARGDLSPRQWGGILALYAVACLFKEHAIVLLAMLPVAELTVVRDGRPLRERVTALRPGLLAMTAIALAFLWMRASARDGDTMGFVPLPAFRSLALTPLQRVLTATGVVPVWARLFVWPADLSIDYSPGQVAIAQSFSAALVPGLVLLLAILALALLVRREHPVVSFGVAWLVLTLLPSSNFIVAGGPIVGERLLYLPSVGALLALVYGLGRLVEYARQRAASRESAAPGRTLARRGPAVLGAALVAVIVVAGGWRTAARTKIWKSNDTLFSASVREHPDNYRINYLYAVRLVQLGRAKESEAYFHRAMQIFPYDAKAASAYGAMLTETARCRRATEYYRFALAVDSMYLPARYWLGRCLIATGQLDSARAVTLWGMRHQQPFLMWKGLLLTIDSLAGKRRAIPPVSAAAAPAVVASGKVPRPTQNTREF